MPPGSLPQEQINPGQTTPQLVSLIELERLAMSQHPALAQASARVMAAQGRWVQAGLRPNPSFGYSGQEIGNEGGAGAHGLYFSREYITGGKLGLSQSTISAEIDAAQQELRTTQVRVMADVRLAFINTLVAQERVRLAEEILRISEDGVTVAAARVVGGVSAPVDEYQAQNEANRAGVRVNNARAEQDGAWRTLSVATGGTPLQPQTLAGTLEGTIPQFDWQTTLDRVLLENPLLAAADANIAAARRNIQRQTAEPIPNVNLQAGVLYNYNANNTLANVQMSVPIPINNANQGAVLAARANLTAAERERDRIMLRLERQLAAVFADYQAAVGQAEWYGQQILPTAENVLTLITKAYEEGEQDYTAVLTAQRTLFEAKQDYLLALQNAHLMAARIEFLLLDDALMER